MSLSSPGTTTTNVVKIRKKNGQCCKRKEKIASRELLEREKNKIMIRERSYKKKLVDTRIYFFLLLPRQER
jgi:hypothetical protein